MAPTTKTTPANASRVYEPLLPSAPSEDDWYSFSDDWTISPFPNYALLNASAPRYKVDIYLWNYLYDHALIWWQDVPATIDAMYLVLDRERFKPKYQYPSILYSSSDRPDRYRSKTFSDDDMVTNPINPVEGAIRIYDKHGSVFKDTGKLNVFGVQFDVDEAEGPRSILDAASIFYVDANGKANFLTFPTEFIDGQPPMNENDE